MLEEEVKALYLATVEDANGARLDLTLEEIAYHTGVPETKVRKIILGKNEDGTDPSCPYYTKKYFGHKLPAKKFVMIKEQLYQEAEASALMVLRRGLDKLNERDDELTITELKDLTNILKNLDNISRLESGKPTEIIKSTHYTPERIIEIIQSDPMYGGRHKEVTYGQESKEDGEYGSGLRETDGGVHSNGEESAEGKDQGGNP